MLYLTNSELIGGYPLPPKEWLEIVLKGMEDVVNYEKQGKGHIYFPVVAKALFYPAPCKGGGATL